MTLQEPADLSCLCFVLLFNCLCFVLFVLLFNCFYVAILLLEYQSFLSFSVQAVKLGVMAPKAKEVGCLIFSDASWAVVHTAMNMDEVEWHTHTPSEDSLVDLDKKGLWSLLLRGGLSVDGKVFKLFT